MNSSKIVSDGIQRNDRVIHAQIEGLSHADSLLQLPFRGNCLNWVLGHIVASRAGFYRILGANAPFDRSVYQNYFRDSDPITGDEQALPFDQIVADLETSTADLSSRINAMGDEDLAALVDGGEETVGERLSFQLWHESYHTGQTEYLRQLAGTNDKII